MTKKNPKRSLQRKEQSERDRSRYLSDQSVFSQVATFQQWLGMVQTQGMNGSYIPIPYELIDLTASFIASLMNGVTSDLILMTSSLSHSTCYRENVNFIRKTLSKAEVSCSSLICSLWYIDQYFQQPHSNWNPRDLFIASIVAADKYLADVTWLNSDWSEWTSYSYTTAQITSLESRFLRQLDFKLYVSPTDYRNFVSYLEFRLHARQLLGDVLLLSYRDMDVLSQSLTPAYVERLQLNIRPFEAMVLLAKQATSILVMYAATLVTLASAGYVLSQYAVTLQKDEIAMMILSGLDLLKQQQQSSSINHQLIAT